MYVRGPAFWVRDGDLVWSDGCETSYMFVCVCVCSFRSVTLNPTPTLLPNSTPVTTAEFVPQSKAELKDAVMEC